MGITEHLTAYNMSLLNQAKEVFGKFNVWTSKCVIFARVGDGPKFQIRSLDDIQMHCAYPSHNPAVAPLLNPPLATGTSSINSPITSPAYSGTTNLPNNLPMGS